jgi:S-ribosylhomocysteine lyase
MDKIESFKVDHTKFGVGMYVSRVDGDITTYDVRMVKPNGGDYLPNPAIHTIEHLFATYARNSKFKDDVIYVGPMGCRTGFYLIMRGRNLHNAVNLVREALEYIRDFKGEIFGTTPEECGNYLEHDLELAQIAIKPLLEVMQNYSIGRLVYPE